MTDDNHAVEPLPTSAQRCRAEVDAIIRRTHQLAALALANHPQRQRALEILEQGGWLFSRPLPHGRHELRVGWFDNPELRPPHADPREHITVMTLPRTTVFPGGNES
jgi:hypothetical protein